MCFFVFYQIADQINDMCKVNSNESYQIHVECKCVNSGVKSTVFAESISKLHFNTVLEDNNC